MVECCLHELLEGRPVPILPKEPDIYPPGLLDQESDDEPRCWWVLYTLPRREKDLMRRLRSLHIPHYGPLIPRRTKSPAGRVRQSFVPLFAGYVFLAGSEQQRYEAMATNCISRCLAVTQSAQLVRDLRQIQRLVESDAPLSPESRITPGTRVRVRSGPLVGLEGSVETRRGQDYLVVAIEFLQQGASVLIRDYELEKIDG